MPYNSRQQRQYIDPQQQGGGFQQGRPSRQSQGGGFRAPQPPQFQLPQFQTPDLSGLQFGGGTAIEGVGSVQAPDQSSTANALLASLANAYGSQTNLMGQLAQTQGGVDQARIGADASRYGDDQRLAGTQYASDSQLRQAELVAELQKELGMYQSDVGLEGEKYGADQQLAGIEAQAGASRYGADQQLAGVTTQAQYGALPAVFQQQRFDQSFPFFQQLAAQLLGGGGGGGGLGPASVPRLDSDAALNRQLAANAQQYASAQGDQGYSGGSPQAGAYGRSNDYSRMLADTEANYQIPVNFQKAQQEAELAAIAAENDRMRAQSSQLSPIFQLLGQYA